MYRLKQSWLGYASISIAIHGAILCAAPSWKGHDRAETIQVSLVAEELSSEPQTAGNKPGAAEHGKIRVPAKAGQKEEQPPIAQHRATTAATESTAQAPAPSIGKQSGPASGRTEPQPQGTSLNEAIARASGKDASSGGTADSTVVATASKGLKGEGAGGGPATPGTGQGPVRFGVAEGPRFVHREVPDYPLYARRRKKEGKVVLKVHLTEKGELSSVEVVEATDPIFVGPSIDAVKRSTFAPATQKGTPVAVSVLLPIRFLLNENLSLAQSRSSL